MYTYIHIPMVFNPQAPTSAKADLSQEMCGAGVTRLRDQSCAAPPWCGQQCQTHHHNLMQMNLKYHTSSEVSYLGGPRLCRRPPLQSFVFWSRNLEFPKASSNEEQHPANP